MHVRKVLNNCEKNPKYELYKCNFLQTNLIEQLKKTIVQDKKKKDNIFL